MIVEMKITSAEKHPNADRLRVYSAEGDGKEITFIANLTNVYEVGDMVKVAQVGHVMEDGMEIKETVIRGVKSYGMGLGKV